MKKQNTLLTIAIITILAIGCKKETKSETIASETKEKYNQIEKANWLLGNWENSTEEMKMKEIWKKENDSCFSAQSFVIVNKDTVFYENVNLIQRNDSLFYIVSVKDQNKEKPVSFYLTLSTEKEMIFENPKHDFPTKIKYNKITNDSLVATIYGVKERKEASELFPMYKKNN